MVSIQQTEAIILLFGLRVKMERRMRVISVAGYRHFQNGNTLHAVLMTDFFRGDMKLIDRDVILRNSVRGTTTPVVSFRDGVSPFGCYDMVGNVWEWTDTPYDDERNFRVACGGAWYYNHDYSTCTSYDFFSNGYAEFVIGFRIAW